MGGFEDLTEKKGPLQLVVLYGGLRCAGTLTHRVTQRVLFAGEGSWQRSSDFGVGIKE